MTGTLRQDGQTWRVEVSNAMYSEPTRQTTSWLVTGCRYTGGLAPTLADGLEVRFADGDSWSAYRHGEYTTITTEHIGLPRCEPIPAPKVRAGVEVRYRDGRWQKYLKSQGWVTA